MKKLRCALFGMDVINLVKSVVIVMYIVRTANTGKDSSFVAKTGKFALPLQRKRNGTYKIPSGNLVYTCFTSDFLIGEVVMTI